MKKKSLLISTLTVCSFVTYAQQEIVSTQGDSYTNGTNTIDFTIGEPVIESESDGTNDLTQGFHQTKLLVTSVNDIDKNFKVSVFPNPTSQFITIKIENVKGETYQLFDINGKVVSTGRLTSASSKVDLSGLANGTFILSISNNKNKQLKTYQIIKQ